MEEFSWWRRRSSPARPLRRHATPTGMKTACGRRYIFLSMYVDSVACFLYGRTVTTSHQHLYLALFLINGPRASNFRLPQASWRQPQQPFPSNTLVLHIRKRSPSSSPSLHLSLGKYSCTTNLFPSRLLREGEVVFQRLSHLLSQYAFPAATWLTS